LQSTRLAESLERLNNSLALMAPELGSRKTTCEQAVFVQTA